MIMNERLLASLGIVGSEAKIYKALLKVHTATPFLLARAAGIKRTTAYHAAQMLARKGLVVEDATKRPRTFSIAGPERVKELVREEETGLKARVKVFKELAEELARRGSETFYPVPRIRFVEEEKLRRFLYAETSKWHESIMKADATWWGFQDHTFIDEYGKITDWYWKRAKAPLAVKLLSNHSATERKIAYKYPRRTIKFWNKANNFVSTTWVIGDYVVMVNTRRRPFYLVEIEDATFAHGLREVFKNLWPLI